MPHFEKLLPLILTYEGVSLTNPTGSANIQGDTGGETNWGISQTEWSRVYHKYPGFPTDVRLLTKDQIIVIYKQEFYPSICETLPLGPALIIFDEEVNAGNGVKVLQKVLGVVCDGVAGPKTLDALRLALRDIPGLVEKLCWQRLDWYNTISKGSVNNQRFLTTLWIPRILQCRADALKFGADT